MHLVTHNGNFHLDEVLSTVILLKIFPYSTVTRTRNNDIIEKADIVYDVGSVFYPESKRFDHHQITFTETYSENFSVKMSSAGLIYKYYQKELFGLYGLNDADENWKLITDRIYETYFLAVDAIDNGYDIYGEIKPRTLQDIVSSIGDECNKDNEDEFFMKAVELVSGDFERFMDHNINYWLPSYKDAHIAIKDCDSNILILDSDKYIAMSIILLVEKELKKDIKYVILKNIDDGTCRVTAVPKNSKTFETKIPLKKEWRGLRDEELEEISGIKGITFVHASGFTGGCKTLEGAIKMCEESIKAYNG